MTSRRKPLPGILRLPDGRCQIRLTFRDPKTGRLRDVKRVLNTRDPGVAAQLRASLLRELKLPSRRAAGKTTVGDYALSWLRAKRAELAPSTFRRYVDALDLSILPAVGELLVEELEREDVIAWRDRPCDLSARTINGHLRVFKTMANDACAEFELRRNPTYRVKPLPEPPNSDDNCLSRDELARFIRAIDPDDHKWRAMFLIAATTGLRFSEASALKWGDLRDDEILVSRSQCNGFVKVTKSSRRKIVPLLPEVKEAIRVHRDGQPAEGGGDGFLFRSSTGTLLRTSSATTPVRETVARAGIRRRFTFHGLRHTFNDLARRQARGEVVRSIMGHSVESSTLHYSHVRTPEKLDAVRAIFGDDMLAGETKPDSCGMNVTTLPRLRQMSCVISLRTGGDSSSAPAKTPILTMNSQTSPGEMHWWDETQARMVRTREAIAA